MVILFILRVKINKLMHKQSEKREFSENVQFQFHNETISIQTSTGTGFNCGL